MFIYIIKLIVNNNYNPLCTLFKAPMIEDSMSTLLYNFISYRSDFIMYCIMVLK